MNRHLKLALGAVAVGALILIAVKMALPLLTDLRQTASSDAQGTRGRITIAIDSWVGYFPLCSPEMKRRMRGHGYLLSCENDGADIKARLGKLRDGDLDFAVGTVDSYVLVGKDFDYPGTVVAVLDESKGGDALVAWRDQVANLDSLKTMPDLKIAFTPDSPSDHLLKALSVHFDIPSLRTERDWRIERQGSSQALKSLLDREAEVAVLWEPDVSKALNTKGIHRLIGTEDTHQLIVDILLANRTLMRKSPETVDLVVQTYFETLAAYQDAPDSLSADLQKATDLNLDQVQTSLRGLVWSTVADNATRWFALDGGDSALVETIEGAVDVLTEFGTLSANPLPNGDPLRLLSSRVIKQVRANADPKMLQSNTRERRFSALSDGEWSRLRAVGTLKIRPIVFASGTARLTQEGRAQLDTAVTHLTHYPNFRVSVLGHTGLRGDADVNRALSLQRAEAVASYLRAEHGLSNNRLRATGLGSAQPLERYPGESARAYNYRLPRVELVLVSGGF